ncbi:AbrB/MazE/SpoVT family DNA-binding domain-containing protein [Hoeflea ulvae]|uniref:AbrB/MazE/SpoVT family DNA-binding domain-containing protein n=1 Tax=Hoeflea ulvae TaxID=2983764 RepID=A0ABT3YJD8_9HYPH|nr:AbrB/MazE/SpoVT family DNA-binding domain-containing protein [Hoeflea ulvae]MCY0095943.1 AbrB/MazE/SpoVT family DNA-binding domain-containing protein [Hoeflea ulvae]
MMTRREKETGFAETGQSGYDPAFGEVKKPMLDRVKLGEGGRLVIPAAMREALGVKPGDELALEVADGELKIKPYLAVIREIQARVQELVPPGVDIVEDFLAERREEQRRSDERFERLHREGMAMREKDK